MKLGFNESNTNQSLRGFLVPTTAGVLAFAASSLVLLLLLSHQAIWASVWTDSGITAQNATEAMLPQFQTVSTFLSQELFAKATVFLLWGCLGAVTYAIIGALQHFAGKVSNDVQASKNVAPKSTNNYWLARLAQYGYVVAILFLLIVMLLSFIGKILPRCVIWMSQTILNYQDITSYKSGLLAILITTVCLYVLTRLFRATSYALHVTFSN